MYRDATTKGGLGTLSGQRRDDIKWDLAHGTIKVARQDLSASASSAAGVLPAAFTLTELTSGTRSSSWTRKQRGDSA